MGKDNLTPRRELEAHVFKLEQDLEAMTRERQRWFLEAQGLARRVREMESRLASSAR